MKKNKITSLVLAAIMALTTICILPVAAEGETTAVTAETRTRAPYEVKDGVLVVSSGTEEDATTLTFEYVQGKDGNWALVILGDITLTEKYEMVSADEYVKDIEGTTNEDVYIFFSDNLVSGETYLVTGFNADDEMIASTFATAAEYGIAFEKDSPFFEAWNEAVSVAIMQIDLLVIDDADVADDDDIADDNNDDDVVTPAEDIPSTWALDIVNGAIADELVPENLQGAYRQATTRAEFCALAVAMYEQITGEEIVERVTFDDTTDVNVQKMAAVKVVSGVGNNKFAPDDKLTREQAATILAQLAAALGKDLEVKSPTFADNAAISTWALAAVGQIQNAKVMGGVGNNTFAPKDAYTREQSIITIVQLMTAIQ